MIRYVLDTDTISLFQRGNVVVRQRLESESPESVAVTVITIEEQLAGWFALIRRARRPVDLANAYRRLASTVEFLAGRRILTFDEPAIARYEYLRASKLGVGKMDLRIAAIALEYRAIVVTRNQRDFERVPGLHLEDWSE